MFIKFTQSKANGGTETILLNKNHISQIVVTEGEGSKCIVSFQGPGGLFVDRYTTCFESYEVAMKFISDNGLL